MIVEELEGDEWREVLRTSSDYYAITLGHLSHLILDAGFESCERSDVEFYQPVLVARGAV